MLGLIAALGLVSLIPRLWRLRREIAGTTLMTAWYWGAAGWGLWIGAWLTEIALDRRFHGIADQLWYAAALVMLCAAVAVLGAKQPGTRVWGLFVLGSLLLVLGWPALFSWRDGWPPGRLVLMKPALAAYAFVCILGTGNYLGTRLAPSAVCFAFAQFLVVMPFSGHADGLHAAESCRTWAAFCLVTAAWLPVLLPRTALARLPLDRVWIDFRNAYGIVWARRIQDRFNDAAVKSNWPARLEADGLYWQLGQPPTNPNGPEGAALREMERTLRWLLRRFVSSAWIDRRMDAAKPQATHNHSLDT